MLAVPALLAATVSFASAQDGAKAQARETSQDAKNAAGKTGNAIGDSWITLKIHSQFVPEDALANSDIDVDTKKGVVMLNGTVASEAARARAVAIAKATDGVNSVMDHLTIAAGTDTTAAARNAGAKAGAATREAARDTRDATKEAARDTRESSKTATGTTGRAVSDGWLKSKIAAQFVTEASLDNSDIDIEITKGAVTLNGAVRTAAAKNRATAIAKATDGVKAVNNNLKINPGVK
jgi:hyperosmotically inducible protein